MIDELEPAPEDHEVDESNLLPRWGTSLQRRGPTARRVLWGRVTLTRVGNRVTATARRVARFTFLIAPDEFDLDEPIVALVDGRVAFESRVTPSIATLLRWATIDDDRTRLFAAEITIEP